MNGKYKVKRITNMKDGKFDYYSADVYYEAEDGSEFFCECGDWNNETARCHAKLIASLLNSALLVTRKDWSS